MMSARTQDEVRVLAWAEIREPLELQLAPLGRLALKALAPRPGESALDIGCGGGETALDLARAVAPDGTVVGIDLSAAVLAFAKRLAKARSAEWGEAICPTSSMLCGIRALQQRRDRSDDVIDGKSELLLQGLQWSGSAKRVHANDSTGLPDVPLPAER